MLTIGTHVLAFEVDPAKSEPNGCGVARAAFGVGGNVKGGYEVVLSIPQGYLPDKEAVWLRAGIKWRFFSPSVIRFLFSPYCFPRTVFPVVFPRSLSP